jgi:hypothetical protein
MKKSLFQQPQQFLQTARPRRAYAAFGRAYLLCNLGVGWRLVLIKKDCQQLLTAFVQS